MDLAGISIVDQHCHPVLADPWNIDEDRFAGLFTEGAEAEAIRRHVPHTAFYRRSVRLLGEALGCEPTARGILEARRRRSPREYLADLFRRERISTLLVDFGHPPDALTPTEMEDLLPCAVRPILRLETLIEELILEGGGFDAFLATYLERLEKARGDVAAFKSIIAYRSGLAIRETSRAEAEAAYDGARREAQRSAGGGRVAAKPLLDHLILLAWEKARDLGIPLQLHTGFGDADIDLPTANPALLRPLLVRERFSSAKVVLLHASYPYFREACHLVNLYGNVYVDLSLAIPLVQGGSIPMAAEILGSVPTTKVLYGSDLGSIPEFYWLGARYGRAALGAALEDLVGKGIWTEAEAMEVAGRVLSRNAEDLYGL